MYSNSPALLRLPAVLARTGLSRPVIYSKIAKGVFPRQVNIGARSVGWLSTEIDEWIAERVAESRGGAQ